MTCPVVCLAVTLVAFSSPDHGWRRSSPDLLQAEQTADGLAIDFSGKDPNLTGPSYVFPVPKKAGSRAVFTLETSPSEDMDEYQLFYAFGKAPFAEHEKLILRPVGGKPPYSRYRAELAAPDYTPGANVSLRLDPPPGEKRKAVLKSLDLSFREPIWTPSFSVPSPFACVGERHVLESSGWRLVQDGARWDAWALEAEDFRVAESPCEEPVAYLDGKGVVRTLDWAQSPCQVRRNEGWLEATTASKDADGTTWTISRRFSVSSGGALDVRTHVATDRPVRLVHFPYLTVLADRASGGRKTQALLPGVEYLADEPSSNEMELRGRDARRTMPEAWKVCFPLMLLVRASGEKARTLSLAWNRENGAYQAASAVFDTPDRQFRSGGHLFALWAPAVESGREANDPAVYEAQPFTGGTVTARLALGGERSVGEALGRLVTGSDLLRPQEVPMSAFVDRVAPGWLGTHLGEGGKWGRPRRVVADVASTLEWLAAHATGSGQRSAFNARLCETMAAFPSNGTERLGWGAQLYRWSSPSGPFLRRSVRRLQREQEGHLARMVKAWSKGYLQYRPSPGKPDYAAGWEAKDANGHSATFLMALMRTAAWSGNEARIAEAVDIVRRMRDRYAGTVPRGAQSWEIPLHTPDIMASAFMADTLALAYQMSGDKTLLESAREWAQTGLAFVYLEEPRAAHPKSVLDPYGLYATTAVLGASEWTLTNWIGRPVQWCGMAYALALLDCAHIVREEAPDKLSCFFYGYSFENSKAYEGSPAATGSFALRKVLSSPDVDVLCGPFGYPPETRALGGGAACHAPAESVLLAGKVWLNEDDNGTHVTAADIAATSRWSPDGATHAGRTVDEAERILVRDMAFCHLRNSAFWWMDLFGRKWHADRRLWDEMGRWRPLENAAMSSNSLLRPDVAVTIHEPSSAYLVHSSVPRGLCEWLANRNRDRISRAGVVYGQYLLDDIMAGRVPDAKLDIHALVFALAGDERRTLALRAQRTAMLWLALPGLIDLDSGFLSTNAVRELTGFDVCFVTPMSFAVRATGDGLAYGLPTAFGQCEASAPLLGVNPMPGDVVLARWMDNPQRQGDGTPAVVYRPAANGHAAAFFSGTNELPQELVRLAARLAGAHVWCDDDLHVQANGRLAAFTAPKAGIYVIRTPSGPVRDVLTGKLLAEGSCLTRRFAKGETLAVSF